MNFRKYAYGLLAGLCIAQTAVFTSCEDEPDKYEIAGGSPTIEYVRLPEKADSTITAAEMEKNICLVGKNLRSIKKMLFNDQVAVLNTSFITDNYLLVDIPSEIPSAVTDKIYMINNAGDTITYDFHVIVPAPMVLAMSCEYAQAGEEVTITGDYFIQDPYKPLQVLFNDSTLRITDFTSISKTAISFILPAGVNPGEVYVKSVYGTSKAAFQYRDQRNILFDFDGTHGGQTGGYGWYAGTVATGGIDGSYLHFGGAAMSGKVGGTWNENAFCMQYWPDGTAAHPDLSGNAAFQAMLDTCDIADMALKFECRVPSNSAWSSAALQIMFTGNADVTYNTANNQYYTNTSQPRGLWMPWVATGSYDTANKWVTITLPLSSFNKTHEGQPAGVTLTKDRLTGLTLFLWQGGVEGTDCNPVLDIDNIRIVPVK